GGSSVQREYHSQKKCEAGKIARVHSARFNERDKSPRSKLDSTLLRSFPATTRQDAWRRSRGVGGKPRTNEVPICRCNDQMAWCPGAAPQLRRTCDPRVRRS